MSSIATLYVPTVVCPTTQDIALCGIIAATTIYSATGYYQWNCTVNGTTTSNPCATPVWPGIICDSNNTIIDLWLNVGMTGMIYV